MQIILNEVAPVFMHQSAFSPSDIWGKKVVIEKGERLQIVAASGSWGDSSDGGSDAGGDGGGCSGGCGGGD